MKLSLLFVFSFITLISIGQVKQQQNTEPHSLTDKKPTKINNSKDQSLQDHPFFEKRNEYIKHLIKVDKKSIPFYRVNETEQENLNRLVKWAYQNKDLFKKEYRDTIDSNYKNIKS